MRFPGALPESWIWLLVLGTVSALSSQDVENRFWVLADNALLSVKEGFIEGTVCDVVVSDVSLVVFFNKVVNVLFA